MAILKNTEEKACDKLNLKEVEEKIKEFRLKQEEKIKKLTSKEAILTKTYNLLAVNIYDDWFYNRYLYSRYFIAYEDEGQQKILQGNYLLEMDEGKIKKIYKED